MTDQDAHPAGSRGARRRARYREIAKVLWEERVFNLMQGSGLEEHVPEGAVPMEDDPSVKEKDLPRAVRIRRALERLGPAFIKMGQILATRRDLVTPDLAVELAKLQDDVPTLSWEEMRPRVETELGAPVEELYASFDTTPIAAASIGQVYRATLRDGTPVAVKVQRPGVTETMEIDLEILVDLGRRVTAHTQWGKDYDVAALTQEFADVLRSELDYTHEGQAMDRFRDAFADDTTIVFPEVFWDHSSGRVLTMTFIDGVPATQLEEGDVPGVDRERLVELGVSSYFRQIFELGFYHADPHAGNLFALLDGRIAFVDFGRTARVSRHNREAVFDMLLAVFDEDPRAATEAVLAMTGMPPEVDVAKLEVELGRLLALYRRSQGSGGGLDDLVQRLLTLVREHQLHLPTELTVLLTTLGMLDGVAAQIDPGFRMVDAAKPFAKKLVPQQFGPDRIFKATLRSARAYARFFDDLPVQATRVLRRAGEGEFRISVRPTEYAGLMERLQAGFSLIAYALIVSALILGAALLVGRPGLSRFEQFGARVVLLAALLSVCWLFGSLVRSEYRKWREAKRAAG
jgi:ubiquinone biosynthesis protein